MKLTITSLLVIVGALQASAQETNAIRREQYPSGSIKTLVLQISPTNQVEREFYESGQLRWELPVGTNGKYNGMATFYYTNGQIESVWQYTDNRSMPLRKYDEDGDEKPFVTMKWRIGKIMHKLSNPFVPPSP